MRPLLRPVLVVAVAGLSACGSDGGGDASDYRAGLDRACRESTTALAQLPRRQAQEDLTTAQLQPIADEIGRDFVAKVKALEPPSDLEDEHEALVALVSKDDARLSTDDPRELVERLKDGERRFRALGATGCADGQKRTVEQIEESLGSSG